MAPMTEQLIHLGFLDDVDETQSACDDNNARYATKIIKVYLFMTLHIKNDYRHQMNEPLNDKKREKTK